MYLKLLSLLLLLNYCDVGAQLLITTEHTTAGQIHGIRDRFVSFLGIPYGVVDEYNPFGPATPQPYFKTPFQAFNDSAICPQIVKGVAKGTIHCLHLNVYKPDEAVQGHRLPVMVYIHGGGFVEGNGRLSTYSPIFLMRHNVIVVTVNYRLGPYGYFCQAKSEYTNQGMKDQNLAIRWVKDHIQSFGGDSENIVLFGHSSGSASVDFHLLYNNENLFNKVILQSGQFVFPYGTEDQVPTFISTVAKKIGWDTENINIDEFIKKISTINTDELIEITKNIIFRPCIDEILITTIPKVKNLNKIKIMVGDAAKEMFYFYPKADSELCENFDYDTELRKGFFKMADQAVEVIKGFYYNGNKVNIIDFVSDFAFNYPMERSIRYYLKNNATVFRYLFSYDGGRNFMKIRDNIDAAGATHGDELGYLFDMDRFGNITAEDQVIIDRISYLWTNFAKYGDPTPFTTNLLPVKWQAVTTRAKPYLQIDTEVGLFNGPFQERMAFWDLYYERFGRFAKGISLGENWFKFAENRTQSVDLNGL